MQIKNRIKKLKAAIKDEQHTIYPDNCEEIRIVKIQALQQRIQYLEYQKRFNNQTN